MDRYDWSPKSCRLARLVLAVAMLIVVGSVAVVPGVAAEPSRHIAARQRLPADDEIRRWIDQLGHDAYTVRQAAAAQLLAAGIAARGPLLEVVDGPDPETRAAARRLVAQIDRSEFNRRLEAFAADVDGQRGLTLPGWGQFCDLIGSDRAARELFVEIQRHEAPLLSMVFEAGIPPTEQVWEERVLRLVQRQTIGGQRSAAPSLGSCAAMLFLGSVAEVNVSDRGAMLVEGLIQRPPIREALQSATEQDALRRLVVAWILHCPNRNDAILRRRLTLMTAVKLHEALPLALDVAGGDAEYTRVAPIVRAMAVLAIGQLGGAEHVPHLEPLLDDASVCLQTQAAVPGQPARHVQVRDVALVVLLQLTDQRPADYGYLHARLQPQQAFQIQSLHLENDQQREKAVAQWRAWRAGQSD